MNLVRFADRADGSVQVGFETAFGKAGGVTPLPVPSLGALLSQSAASIERLLKEASEPHRPVDQVLLLPPIDGATEVWAAGVTYVRSRDGRMEESAQASIYEQVYDAVRPELFLKAVPWRVVTDGEPIAVRRDSPLNVPEPELAIVVNAHTEIVGYTICDDVSSRSIEGDNPLYLPQAKVYAGSCALASRIRPAWEVGDPHGLAITLAVDRDGQTVWEGKTNTSQLHRPLDELVRCLFAEQDFPEGVVIATGTGIVPELSFSLQAGDAVTIEIEEVGVLVNPVVAGKDALAWLVPARQMPSSREAVRQPLA